MLSELEEIIVYKQYADQTDRQAAMRKTWMKRCVFEKCAILALTLLYKTARLSARCRNLATDSAS
jgi:hypothetical protein